jgi:hypothetical protein
MRLANPKVEKYAAARAKGLSQTKSAVAAGFSATSAPNAGYRFERVEGMQERIAEIFAEEQPDGAGNASRTAIMRNLAEIVRIGLGRETRDLNAAYKALEMQCKLNGFVDKKDRSDVNLASLTSAQLNELLNARLDQLSPGVRSRVLSLAYPDEGELTEQ